MEKRSESLTQIHADDKLRCMQVGAAREHGHFYAVYARWYDDGLQGCAAAECVGFDSCDTFSDSCTSQAGTALEHG